jgi:predicted outer membrane repeat protein
MKTPSIPSPFSRILALAALAPLLTLSLAPFAHGQTVPTVDFDGAKVPRTSDASADYVIDDSNVLTFAVTGQMATGPGAIFNATAGVYHFSATTSGPNHTGGVIINGNSTLATPIYTTTTGQGGAFYMNSAGGGGYITVIGGTNATGATGTITNFWATSAGGVAWLNTGAAGNGMTWKNLDVVDNGVNGGSATASGGVVYATNSVKLDIENVTFKNNSAVSTATALGGAIYMTSSASLKGTNVAFVGNSLLSGRTNAGGGGAIYAHTASTVTLTDVLFDGNSAYSLGGGAVYAQGASVVTVNGGTFTNNSARGGTQTAAASTSGNGGAIYNNGSTVMVTDVVFVSNTANTTGNGSQGRGGAVYVASGTFEYTVTKDTHNYGNAGLTPTIGTASAALGGFLMNGGNLNHIVFNVADGKTLTIGNQATPELDTIASGGQNAFHVININPGGSYSGAVVLNADNSNYTSQINVEAGALLLGNTDALLSFNEMKVNGGIFGGSGTIVVTGSYVPGMTINTGGTLQMGYGRLAAETFTISGTLTLAAGSTLDYGIYAGNSSDQLVLADGEVPLATATAYGPFKSTLNVAGPTTINLSAATKGTYDLISMPAGIAAGSNLTDANLDTLFNVTVDGVALDPASYALGIDDPGTTLFIVVNTGVSDIAPPDTSSSTGTDITATSFTANWPSVAGATGYVIDVATDPSFATVTMVAGYNKLPVTGTDVSVTGLTGGITYYYRVRSVDADGAGANSDIVTVIVPVDPGALITLVNDVFSDTDRIGGTDGSATTATSPAVSTPTSTNTQWVTSTAGSPSALIATGGASNMVWTFSGTGAALIHGYMPLVTIASGKTVTLTLKIKTGALGTGVDNFRMAIFNDAATGATRAQYDGSPVTGNGRNTTGYGFFSATGVVGSGSNSAALNFNINKRTDLAPTNMLSAGAGWTDCSVITHTNSGGNFDADTEYTLTYAFAYDGTNLGISLGIDGGTYSNYKVTATDTSGSPNLDFNAIVLRMGKASLQFASMTIRELTVTEGNTVIVPQPPAAPLATDVTDIDNTSFTANWDASADATGYLLEVATDSAFTDYVTGYASRDVGNTTSASVTGLTTGVTYYYRVRALNANGGSGYSNIITATTAPPITVVPVITSATAISVEVDQPFSYIITADNEPTSFGATGLPASLTLDTATGEITGTPVDGDIGEISVTLTATNHIGESDPVTLTLTIVAAMTEPPVIDSAGTATGQQDVAFSYQLTSTNLGGNYQIASGTLPAGLTLDATTGLISGTPTVNGTFNISLTATNSFGPSAPFSLTITINPPLPAITSALTASGTTGVAFSYQITASNSPTSFTATDLPAGLTLDAATGLISGTPVTEAEGILLVADITLTATNVTGASPAATLVLTIVPPLAEITSPPAVTGMVDVAFNYQITASNAPSSFTAAGLPAGLTLNAATGLIAGTPAASGTFDITLTATNGAGPGPSSTLNLTIAPLAVPIFTSTPNASGMVGAPFEFQVATTFNPDFTATGLPPGLTLNAATGAITGTPTTSGSYDIVILAANHVATDQVATNTQQLTITIDGTTDLVTFAGTSGSAGNANGTIATASFNAPAGAVADIGGNLFIADTKNNAIRRIAPDGQVTTLALTGLNAPAATAISPDGATLYIADTGNDQVHAVALVSGQVAPVATTGNNQIRAATLASGQVATITVTGLDKPSGVVVDPDGNLYIANTGASTIIKIAAGSETQTTLAGTAGSAGTVDGIGASARFNLPTGLAASPDGATLYVADTYNNTIRAIDLFSRQVITLAGAAQQPGFADGAPADARFNMPQALAVDAAGNVYVADTGNNTIRKIALTNGVTTTLAGTGTAGTGDGSGLQAHLSAPAGIAIDADGDVYIGDTGNNTIRVLQTGPVIHVQPGSLTVNAGAPASLTVVAGGAPNPTYQWTRDSVALTGGTAATYDIPSASASDSGAYAVTVTNPLGTVTSAPATLTVSEAPTPPVEQPSTGGGGGGGGGGAPTWLFLCALTALAAARGHSSRRNR